MNSNFPDALDIDTNRRLLNRYRFVAQELMLAMASWLPKTPRFELKCEMAQVLWEEAQHVNSLYLRLREIQSPAFQTPTDLALVTLMREVLDAPDGEALYRAVLEVIIPSLEAALRSHESATFPNSDQPSVYALRHILLDVGQQRKRAQDLTVSAGSKAEAEINGQWKTYIAALLEAAGGVSGQEARSGAPTHPPACRTPFQPATEAGRDSRFTNRGSDFEKMPEEENYREHTVEEFERYSTEMLAAETVAVVLSSLRGMPWEFQFDSARHLFDEVRHALMGYEWMRHHGMNPFDSPQYLQVFKWRNQFPPVTQYCMLTMGNEVHAFPYRHRRVEAHQQSGDVLSEQFVRYDIADETQHVRFGKRWLPEMLKHIGESRSLEAFTADALRIWETEYRTGKLTINVE